MPAPGFVRRPASVLALAFWALTAAACSPGSSRGPAAATASAPTAAPVYPGSKREAENVSSMIGPAAPSGTAFSTNDTFETVYGWYKKNMPNGSERSYVTSPQAAAIFIVGAGSDRISVTITTSPLCCKTLIVIANAGS